MERTGRKRGDWPLRVPPLYFLPPIVVVVVSRSTSESIALCLILTDSLAFDNMGTAFDRDKIIDCGDEDLYNLTPQSTITSSCSDRELSQC
jgi:hypothetical protein